MRRAWVSILVCTALVVGCATPGRHTDDARVQPQSVAAACEAVPGSMRWARTELYFGMRKPDNSLTSNEEYQRFVDEEVTPRFRDGFTVLDGRGQYLSPNGRLWHEPTKILVLSYPPDPSKNKAIDEIRNAYKLAFQQESVMRVDGTTCVAF